MNTKTTLTTILSILLITLLASCDSKPDATASSTKGTQQKPQGAIPEHQLQALQKAKEAKKSNTGCESRTGKSLKTTRY